MAVFRIVFLIFDAPIQPRIQCLRALVSGAGQGRADLRALGAVEVEAHAADDADPCLLMVVVPPAREHHLWVQAAGWGAVSRA